jgi:hypothetical protein
MAKIQIRDLKGADKLSDEQLAGVSGGMGPVTTAVKPAAGHRAGTSVAGIREVPITGPGAVSGIRCLPAPGAGVPGQGGVMGVRG